MGGNIMNAEKLAEILKLHKEWLKSYWECGERANLRGADLSGAYLRGADLSGAYLSGAYLRGADLSGADLSGAYLSGADLSDADLSGADLSGADLSGADLSGANLSGANLSGANLSGADLIGANLRDANLRDADLRRADLRGADLPAKTFAIHGYLYFIFIHERQIRAGCQIHTAEEWRSFSKEYIAEMDGKDALRFYPELLKIIDFYCGEGQRPDWLKESN